MTKKDKLALSLRGGLSLIRGHETIIYSHNLDQVAIYTHSLSTVCMVFIDGLH